MQVILSLSFLLFSCANVLQVCSGLFWQQQTGFVLHFQHFWAQSKASNMPCFDTHTNTHQLLSSSTSYARVIPLSFLPLCNSPEISRLVRVYMCVIFYSTHRSDGLLNWRLKEQWIERERVTCGSVYTAVTATEDLFSSLFILFLFYFQALRLFLPFQAESI